MKILYCPLILMILTADCFASIIIVPDNYPTIQMAFDSAGVGDTIYLQPGSYSGNLIAPVTPVMLFAVGNIDETIINDGTGNLGAQGEIRGITFRKFRLLTSETKVIRNCNFLNSTFTAEWDNGSLYQHGGGAVEILSGSPHFINCSFINNAEEEGWRITNSGILYYHGAGGAVESGTFYSGPTYPVFDSCIFIGNRAERGGAFAGYFSAPTFRYCTFLRNSSDGWGGAIYAYKATIDHCTFFGNSASTGCHIQANDTLKVTNCILAFGKGDAAVATGIRSNFGYTDIYGNEGGDWTGVIASQSQTNHNLSADPLFCNPEHDVVTLAQNSPCYKSGIGGYTIGAFGVGCDVPTDVTSPPSANQFAYELKQNAPNPFNLATRIVYSLERNSHVVLTIYNILGQKVAVLLDDSQPAGWHETIWDGKDGLGNTVASGIYLYLLKTDDYQASRRMILIK